jgi:hypothetical protein
VTAAFQANQRAAENAAGEVKEYAKAVEGIKGDALFASAADVVISNLSDETAGVQNLFREAGFQAREFEGLARRVFTGASTPGEEFFGVLESIGGEIGRLGREMRGNPSLAEAVFGDKGQLEVSGALKRQLDDLGIKASDLRGLYDALNDETSELRSGIEQAGNQDFFRGTSESIERARGGILDLDRVATQFFERSTTPDTTGFDSFIGSLEEVKRRSEEAYDALQTLFGTALPPSLQQSIDDLVLSIPGISSALAGVDLSTGLGGAQFRSTIADTVSGFIGLINEGLENGEITGVPQLQDIKNDLLAQMREQLSGGEGGLTAVEAQFLIDAELALNQITDAPELAAQIAQYLTGQAPVNVDVPATVNLVPTGDLGSLVDRLVDSFFGGGGSSLGSGNPGPFGMARSVGGGGAPREIDVPIKLNPKVTGINLKDIGVTGVQIVAAIANNVTASAGLLRSAIAAAVNASITVVAGAAGAFQAAGVALMARFATGISGGTKAAVGAAAAAGNAASSAVRTSSDAAYSAGLNVSLGLARGIAAGAGAAIAQARAMAAAVAAAARSALAIKSPSQVFYDIGTNIGLGLANGLADAENDVADAVEKAMQAAIRMAEDQYRNFSAIAAATASLFNNLGSGGFNGSSASGNLSAFAGVGQLGGELRQFLDEQARELFSAVSAVGEGTSNFLQQRINHEFAVAGVGFQSFDPSTIFGSENARQFLAGGQQIREYAAQLLHSGEAVGAVVSQIQSLRDAMTGAAAEVGASQDELHRLVEALGLTDAQLGSFINQVNALTTAAATPVTPPKSQAQQQAEDEASRQAERAREDAERAVYEAQIEALKEQLRIAGAGGTVREVHVHVPYGDPEAVGLGVANRLAYDALGGN